MGRPRKLEPSVLVALVDGYYEEKAAGNAAKIRFSSLEAYAEEKGYTVKSYDFSRCREAVVRIEELKNSEEMRREETLAAAYKSLEVEGLLKQCTTVEALKETLIRMDGYWKRTYMEASALITRDRAFMQEKGKLDGKIRSLKEENARLQENGKEMLKENTALKRENVYLRRMLRTYLYPGIANQILKESGLPVEGRKKTGCVPGTAENACPGVVVAGTTSEGTGKAGVAGWKPLTWIQEKKTWLPCIRKSLHSGIRRKTGTSHRNRSFRVPVRGSTGYVKPAIAGRRQSITGQRGMGVPYAVPERPR